MKTFFTTPIQELDVINYVSIHVLEQLGIVAPNQQQIDYMENLLKGTMYITAINLPLQKEAFDNYIH